MYSGNISPAQNQFVHGFNSQYMKNVVCLLAFTLLLTQAYGQVNTDPKVLGDKAFRDKNYYEAAFYYQKSAQGLHMTKQIEVPYNPNAKKAPKTNVTERGYIAYRLAESYRLYQNYLEAEPWYYRVLNENLESKYPLARLWYGVCLRANQHFDESIKQLQQFVFAYKGNAHDIDMAKKEIATCHFALEQYQYPQLMDVVKMTGTWNSDGSDYAIVKRDKNYWFTSSRLIKDDKKHLNRLYTANILNGFKPEMISFKNDDKESELEYGTPSFNPNGKVLYFTRWYKDGAKTIRAIYRSNWINNEWAKPVKLNPNVNIDGFSAIQPFVTADGRQLYYSSNKPGGQGGEDIWVSDLDADGNPVNSLNLGPNVNSADDEQAPFYDQASKRLVYSSKGFLGLGGFDFFESYNQIGKWSPAQNLGYPMNSAKDDLYYYPDNEHANQFYISSDRASDCCIDLFQVTDQRHTLAGMVTDCDTHQPLTDAKVTYLDSLTKRAIKVSTLDKTGKYRFTVATKRPYQLAIEKAGYFTKVVTAPASGQMVNDTLFAPDICLQAFTVNKPIVLKNILYDYNSTALRPESKAELDRLVTILKNNPHLKVELASHTDGMGSDAFNLKLSTQRAQVCVKYIVSHGISDSRIFPRGYGKRKPVAPNTLPNGQDNPDGRQKNRRTEFIVLKTQ